MNMDLPAVVENLRLTQAEGLDCSRYSPERNDPACVEKSDAALGVIVGLGIGAVVLMIAGFFVYKWWERRVLARAEAHEPASDG